jgi:hypothetical protein
LGKKTGGETMEGSHEEGNEAVNAKIIQNKKVGLVSFTSHLLFTQTTPQWGRFMMARTEGDTKKLNKSLSYEPLSLTNSKNSRSEPANHVFATS